MENLTRKQIYTVSTLTREIKSLLENKYPMVWITGEISNFSTPSSGHSYFLLKDEQAAINCVMFRHQKSRLVFSLENGMAVTGLGRISVYEPRGTYQLIFEHLEPLGAGALQAAFEQLKQKLSDEGLFDKDRRKPLPYLPLKISLITSPTGAAVRDIITVARRRFSNVHLQVVPVAVQGARCQDDLVSAIQLVNRQPDCDLIILARGGGSLEDFQGFNSEPVARAIAASTIPIISAVGHEIDFSIADFVADLRAPTPSAAAEIALPEKSALIAAISGFQSGLIARMAQLHARLLEKIRELKARLKSPARIVDDMRLRLEDLQYRLVNSIQKCLDAMRSDVFWLQNALKSSNPGHRIAEHQALIRHLTHCLETAVDERLSQLSQQHQALSATLKALNPEQVLKRGYSITRIHPEQSIVTDAAMVKPGDFVDIRLNQGKLICEVKKN